MVKNVSSDVRFIAFVMRHISMSIWSIDFNWRKNEEEEKRNETYLFIYFSSVERVHAQFSLSARMFVLSIPVRHRKRAHICRKVKSICQGLARLSEFSPNSDRNTLKFVGDAVSSAVIECAEDRKRWK